MDKIKQTIENPAEEDSKNNYIYAKFEDRLAARIIDLIMTSIVAYIIFINNEQSNSLEVPQKFLWAFTGGFLIYHIIYGPIMESLGGTLGKKITKIRTIDIKSGKAPSIIQTFKRTAYIFIPLWVVAMITSPISHSMNFSPNNMANNSNRLNSSHLVGLIPLAIYILPQVAMLWSPTKQGWHDKFSNIAVIKISTE